MASLVCFVLTSVCPLTRRPPQPRPQPQAHAAPLSCQATLGARAALEKAGRADQVLIIGFDGQPEGKQAIKDGKLYADPIQFPDKMGQEIARAIVAHSKGQTLPPQTLIPTKLYRKADAAADSSLK